MDIVKTQLHPENDKNKILYPETSADQVKELINFITNSGQFSSKIVSITAVGITTDDTKTITTLRVLFADNTSSDFQVTSYRGPQGETGRQGDTGATGATGPQGPAGATGRGIDIILGSGYQLVGNRTVTPISVRYTDNTSQILEIYAFNGQDGDTGPQGPAGEDGNSISSIHTVSHSVVGDETITNVEVTFTQAGSPKQTFEVHAQNGTSNVYTHTLILKSADPYGIGEFSCKITNNKPNATISDFIGCFAFGLSIGVGPRADEFFIYLQVKSDNLMDIYEFYNNSFTKATNEPLFSYIIL